jgi:hypothetical protein
MNLNVELEPDEEEAGVARKGTDDSDLSFLYL